MVTSILANDLIDTHDSLARTQTFEDDMYPINGLNAKMLFFVNQVIPLVALMDLTMFNDIYLNDVETFEVFYINVSSTTTIQLLFRIHDPC